MTKHYELTYTIPKNLAPEEASSLFERIISYFPQAAASRKENDFFSLEFYSETELISDLEKKLKSESQIEKFLIVKKEKIKMVKMRTKSPAKTEEKLPTQEQKVEKVELKEIDEKLKEIFGE